MKSWSPFLFVLAVARIAQAQDPGVSESLSRDRAARISNVRYELSFTIPKEKTATIKGHEVITFALRDASSPLVVDFKPARGGQLVYQPSQLHAGANRLVIDFDAG